MTTRGVSGSGGDSDGGGGGVGGDASRPQKRPRALPPSRKEMETAAALEQALFGGATAALDAMEARADDGNADGGVSIAALVRREARRAAPPPEEGPPQEAGPGGAVRAPGRQQAPKQAVWTDESDAQLRVRVASVNRLRKLRESEEEAVLDGAQYEERLRRQHAALHPNTSWARLLPKAARERAAGGGSDGDGDDDGGPQAALGALLGSTPAALLLGGARSRGGPAAGADALGMPLPPHELSAVRVRDGNAASPAHSVVRSVCFHASAPLLLAAGLDKTLRLFSVDGSRNPQVGGVHFADMPIHRASFGGGGDSVVLTGRRPFFYVHHLERGTSERVTCSASCGLDDKSVESFAASPQGWPGGEPLVALFADSGRIPLVSLRSRQAVATLQMAGTVRCGAFCGDGRTLLTGGGDGVVCVWDLRTRRCVDKLIDCGSTGITALAASPAAAAGGHFWAAGGAMGAVNVYRRWAQHLRLDTGGGGGGGGVKGRTSRRATVDCASPCAPQQPQPVRSLGNLTTTVDTLEFSPDGQMLAMATRLSKDALRLVHLPSCSVFANWPSSKTPLHYVHCCAFSPHCGYLAVGNARGRVLLYRLPHYDRL